MGLGKNYLLIIINTEKTTPYWPFHQATRVSFLITHMLLDPFVWMGRISVVTIETKSFKTYGGQASAVWI